MITFRKDTDIKRNYLYLLLVILLVIFTILFSLLSGICTEENIIVEWDKTFGGNNNDRAYSLIQTNDGGYAVAGITESKGTDKEDFWVIKFSEKKADPILPLLFALILPALFIIYYLFVLPIKKRKRKVRREENKETIEVFSHHQKEDSQEEIREQLSDEPIPYDPIIREYREIQGTHVLAQ